MTTYGCNTRGFMTYAKENPQKTGTSCCVSNPHATYYVSTDNCTGLLTKQTVAKPGSPAVPVPVPAANSVSGYVASTKNINDTFENIERFFQQTLPPLNTGLSSHTEKVIFFGLPFVLFISILISILVLIGLSIDHLKN